MSKTLAPSRVVTARDSKGRKFMEIVEAAYNKAGLSEEEAQAVNQTPGLGDLIARFIAENRIIDKYRDEEGESSECYPEAYAAKTLDAQIARLRELFPDLHSVNEALLGRIRSGKIHLPQQAEAWFVVPNIWGNKRPQDFGNTYNEAVVMALKLLLKSVPTDKLDEAHFRQGTHSQECLAKLSARQGHPDLLIIAAQFGLRHRGRSVRRAIEVFKSDEFGLGVFVASIMLLTHPERIQDYDDLWIDCAGDETSDGDGIFYSFPPGFFPQWNGNAVELILDMESYNGSGFGPVSGFVPQK